MVSFEAKEDKIIFTYNYSDYINTDWIRDSLKKEGYVNYKSTFYFSVEDLYNEVLSEEKKFDPDKMSISDIEYLPVSFVFAEKVEDYFKVKKNILSDKRDIYFHKDIDLDLEYFVAETKISSFVRDRICLNKEILVRCKKTHL